MSEPATVLALSCTSIAKSYGGNHVLQGLDLELVKGSLTLLTGGNGSGKTTLLDIISGYVVADEGRVDVGGKPITGMSPSRVAQMGVSRTFQANRVIRQVSVRDNLCLAVVDTRSETLTRTFSKAKAWQNPLGLDVAIDLARAFGLANVLDTQAGNLSYGQQKLVAVAAALSRGHRLLLMDEPMAGVSKEARIAIASAASDARASGVALLVVEHDPGPFLQIADAVLRLEGGRARTAAAITGTTGPA